MVDQIGGGSDYPPSIDSSSSRKVRAVTVEVDYAKIEKL
jgi:hypothetical protein